LASLVGHTKVIRRVAFSADGQRVVTASDDHYGTRMGRTQRSSAGHARPRRPGL
jgi:WD40 repeat protein